MHEEFNLAVERGVFPIPVGLSGSVSLKLWEMVMADRKKYFGRYAAKVAAPMKVLNKKAASDAEILNAVFAILKEIAP